MAEHEGWSYLDSDNMEEFSERTIEEGWDPRTAMAADHFMAMMTAGVLETRMEADRFTVKAMIGVIRTPVTARRTAETPTTIQILTPVLTLRNLASLMP